MLHYLKFTVGASTTAISTRTPCYEVQIQNNAGHDIRVGDSTASVTNNIGYLVKSGGTPPNVYTAGPFSGLWTDLANIFISGTANDVIDVIFHK